MLRRGESGWNGCVPALTLLGSGEGPGRLKAGVRKWSETPSPGHTGATGELRNLSPAMRLQSAPTFLSLLLPPFPGLGVLGPVSLDAVTAVWIGNNAGGS